MRRATFLLFLIVFSRTSLSQQPQVSTPSNKLDTSTTKAKQATNSHRATRTTGGAIPIADVTALEGTWTGTLDQPNASFHFQLDIQSDGNNLKGTSRIEAATNAEYPGFAVMRFTGTIKNGNFQFQETTIIQQQHGPGTYWCIKKGTLVLTADGLSGQWNDPGCNAGMVHLTRQNVVYVYFFIAYLNDEKPVKGQQPCRDGNSCFQSYPRAAETWEREVKATHPFQEGRDLFIHAYVRSADDFVRAWKNLAAVTSKGNSVVIEGGIFTHASFLNSGKVWRNTGLEFAGLPDLDNPTGASSTLTQEMINALPKLQWDKAGHLILFGCNTATPRGVPLWSPAEVFSTSQRVTTSGEIGYAYFSKSDKTYIEVDARSPKIYIGAYVHGWNRALTQLPSGYRIPPRQIAP